MLRITISCDERSICFRLEGKLVGPWANELRRAWDATQSQRQDRSCLLDLSAVNFVDGAGRQVLAHCFAEGARLKAAGPLTSYIVESIVREQASAAKPSAAAKAAATGPG